MEKKKKKNRQSFRFNRSNLWMNMGKNNFFYLLKRLMSLRTLPSGMSSCYRQFSKKWEIGVLRYTNESEIWLITRRSISTHLLMSTIGRGKITSVIKKLELAQLGDESSWLSSVTLLEDTLLSFILLGVMFDSYTVYRPC